MAATVKRWTLEEVHSLPDDGNTYELVRGNLFVTPPPSVAHEELAAVLAGLLQPFVVEHELGRVHRPRAVVRGLGSEVEPDLMVRAAARGAESWSSLPLPILVVEIASDGTRRRDLVQKRQLYADLGIPEYWLIDGNEGSIRVIRPNEIELIATDSILWTPQGAAEAFRLDVARYFRDALRGMT